MEGSGDVIYRRRSQQQYEMFGKSKLSDPVGAGSAHMRYGLVRGHGSLAVAGESGA